MLPSRKGLLRWLYLEFNLHFPHLPTSFSPVRINHWGTTYVLIHFLSVSPVGCKLQESKFYLVHSPGYSGCSGGPAAWKAQADLDWIFIPALTSTCYSFSNWNQEKTLCVIAIFSPLFIVKIATIQCKDLDQNNWWNDLSFIPLITIQ